MFYYLVFDLGITQKLYRRDVFEFIFQFRIFLLYRGAATAYRGMYKLSN